MALSVTGEQVESVLRGLLPEQGYEIQNPPRDCGETGADIIALQGCVRVFVECIGFQKVPPLRSKQFYEAFFRAVSRLKNGAQRCVMALPVRFGRGMNQRARHYGEAWKRIADTFPELEIWLVDVENNTYEVHKWNDWPVRAKKNEIQNTSPRKGTIGNLVFGYLRENADIPYEEMLLKVHSRFPWSKFNKQHFSWYKWKMKKISMRSRENMLPGC